MGRAGIRSVGFVLAPLVTIVFLFVPTALDSSQQTLAAVLLGVVVLWVCEPGRCCGTV